MHKDFLGFRRSVRAWLESTSRDDRIKLRLPTKPFAREIFSDEAAALLCVLTLGQIPLVLRLAIVVVALGIIGLIGIAPTIAAGCIDFAIELACPKYSRP